MKDPPGDFLKMNSLDNIKKNKIYLYPSGHIHIAACGPIRTKFGTHMQINLEMAMG